MSKLARVSWQVQSYYTLRNRGSDALRCGPGGAPLRARLMRYGFTQPGAVFETPCSDQQSPVL